MWFWIVWGLSGLFWELFAIATHESKYISIFGHRMQIITLSRTIWRLCKFEDRSYDKHEKLIRTVFTIGYIALFGWAGYHLGWGPCAGNIC